MENQPFFLVNTIQNKMHENYHKQTHQSINCSDWEEELTSKSHQFKPGDLWLPGFSAKSPLFMGKLKAQKN